MDPNSGLLSHELTKSVASTISESAGVTAIFEAYGGERGAFSSGRQKRLLHRNVLVQALLIRHLKIMRPSRGGSRTTHTPQPFGVVIESAVTFLLAARRMKSPRWVKEAGVGCGAGGGY